MNMMYVAGFSGIVDSSKAGAAMKMKDKYVVGRCALVRPADGGGCSSRDIFGWALRKCLTTAEWTTRT